MKKNVNALIFDAEQELAPNGTVITASGVLGAAVDLKGLGFGKGTIVLNTEAIDEADADETYAFDIELSEDAAFTSPVVRERVTISAVGREFLPFNNQVGDTMYRYVRLSGVLAGTTPSYTGGAYISEDLLPR